MYRLQANASSSDSLQTLKRKEVIVIAQRYGFRIHMGKKAEFFHPDAAARQVGIERKCKLVIWPAN